MALRIPPGRAGRQWLAARIATAEHARDLLEQKRAVLIGAEREAAALAAAASALWRTRAAEAERWLERTAVLDGERPRRLARAHSGPAAAMRITWETTMGVAVPADAYVALPPPPDVALLPGGSALTSALAAHRACAGRGAASRCRAGCTRAARRRAPRDGAASAGDRVPLAAAARAGTRRPRADARRARPRGGRAHPLGLPARPAGLNGALTGDSTRAGNACRPCVRISRRRD